VQSFVDCESAHVFYTAGADDADVPVSRWLSGIAQVSEGQTAVYDQSTQEAFLPLTDGDNRLLAVAVLEGVPDGTKHGGDWLDEQARHVSREIALIRQWAVDPMTGLLSGHCFLKRISAHLEERRTEEGEESLSGCLVLVEMYPRAKNAEQATLYSSRAGAYLDTLVGHLSAPCHFGDGVFGLFWEDIDADSSLKMADMLLRWLKRENIARVHAGLSFTGNKKNGENGNTALEQAWEALGTARKRGPYSLCSYETLAGRQDHPLCSLPPTVTASLRRLCRNRARFSCIFLQQNGEGEGTGRILSLAGPEVIFLPIDSDKACVFLPDMDGEKALEWCQQYQQRLKSAQKSCSLGLASYPFHDFKKYEIVENARKALLHAGFYSPDSLTVFDAVSLNISGDIFYNEGDLARAVKEYRRGLSIDSENVNLLNSLGVTYAQMNRYHLAIPLFEKVLALDSGDFMALFNLGFALLARGEKAALGRFEEALAIDGRSFGLLLQLGKMYCRAGRYEEAIDVLLKGKEIAAAETDFNPGLVYRYLGQAYAGLGRNREAMAHLQRAVSHNPRDAASLSLLGELYDLEKQGDVIALSLCRQAVGLDGSRWQYWSRLGRVELSQKDGAAAVQSFEHGLRVDGKRTELWFDLGRVHEMLGSRKAVKMYEKVLKLDGAHQDAAAALDRLEEKT
ncbi:MAG: tetratricopeptide repeat protein, partial [Thermodesulfobacteriota bacterium]|nr:tetratricopeptide repeat protein [Thermodesulfobacteriota bacterium]